MLYAHDCAGINAPGVAWPEWECAWTTEIDPFCCSVLKHHWPQVPNLGDTTKVNVREQRPVDLLVGGTPCQGFSVAGRGGGLSDPRTALAWNFLRLLEQCRPRWVIWENVSGALTARHIRDSLAFAGKVQKLGYLGCLRVLDAQYFGVPQRRHRVFLVGHLGDWRPAAAVLFERASLRGYPPPRRKTGKIVAALTKTGVGTCGADDNQAQAGHLIAYGGGNTSGEIEAETCLGHHGRHQDFDVETFLVSLTCGDRGISPDQACGAMIVPHGKSGIRRLTPRECERLMGFPDDFTLVPYRGKPAKDGPRYKALGNSIAVPVLRFLGQRIELVSSLA